jgi:hypothetical protein
MNILMQIGYTISTFDQEAVWQVKNALWLAISMIGPWVAMAELEDDRKAPGGE